MKTTDKRQLGQTGVCVSTLGLGTAPLADLYGSVPESQAVETIQLCMELGITYFDTAPLYGNQSGYGLAEERLGIALAGVKRDQYVLSTKVGVLPMPEGGIKRDFSRDGVMRSVEGSLQRLNIDSIDILLIHDPDNDYHEALNQAYPTLVDLKHQGVVKAIGVGMNQWQMLIDFANHAEFDCFMLAGQYTLLVQDGLALMDLCQEKGIGILSAGIYNSGILATGPISGAKYFYRDAPLQILEQVRQMEAICDRYDVPLRVAALRFPAGHAATSTLVVGTSSATRLNGYLSALQWPIPPVLWTDLQDEGLLFNDVPLPSSESA